VPDPTSIFPEYQKKVASMMAEEIEAMGRRFGIERLGFLTLTFPDKLRDREEASQRYRSLRAHVLAQRYLCGISNWERHLSACLHIHLIIALHEDIRTGIDFDAIAREDYRTAPPALLREWAFLRETLPGYGFGRSELLPVKSTVQGVARYCGGYLSKGFVHRCDEDKHKQLVGFFGFGRSKDGHRRSSVRMSWNTAVARAYRLSLATFAAVLGLRDMSEMKEIFGPNWNFILREFIREKVYQTFDMEGCAKVESDMLCGKETESCLRVPTTMENFRLRLHRLSAEVPQYVERKKWEDERETYCRELEIEQLRNRWSKLTPEDIFESVWDYEIATL
jgi:hypothetical protein